MAILLVLGLGAVIAVAAAWVGVNLGRASAITGIAPSSMELDMEGLLALQPEQLAAAPIELMNLACVQGLPGSEGWDGQSSLAATLDRWSSHIRVETNRNLHKFRANPAEYNNSEAYFRILVMVTVLQQDLKVHYNAERAAQPDFRDSRDLFIHGILQGRGGTCASMPALYVAIGRRLGYPLKLVAAKGHLFARWDNGKERFNIEATNEGLNTFDDDYYKTWPGKMAEAEMGYYLKSMSPAEELAAFMALRGDCLESNGHLAEAQVAYAQAHRLVPRFRPYFGALVNCVQRELTESGYAVGSRTSGKPDER